MDSKHALPAVVSIVVVVALIASAFVVLNGNNDIDSEKTSKTFVDSYEGAFGNFAISEGSSKEKTILTSQVKQYLNLPEDEGLSSNSFVVYSFKMSNNATEKYNELVADMTSSSAMCSDLGLITLEGKDAQALNCMKITMHVWARDTVKDTKNDGKYYTYVNGVAMVDNNTIVDFSKIPGRNESADNSRLYIGAAVESQVSETYTTLTLSDVRSIISEFLGAFSGKTVAKCSAADFAKAFVSAYSKEFGTFTVKESDAASAIITSQVKQYNNLPADEGLSSNSVKIYAYSSAIEAEQAYTAIVKGITATSAMCSDLGTVNLVGEDANAYHADKIIYKVWARDTVKDTKNDGKYYTYANGVALVDGHYIVDFSKIPGKNDSADNSRLYYGTAIESTEVPGFTTLTAEQFNGIVAGFISAF